MSQPLFRFLATKNYKNLSLDKNINLTKLNIFIGSNGSGKSNFINCLKFLKHSLTTIAEESRGVSSFENAVTQIGGNKILDGEVASPAVVRLAYCFSQISQTGTSGRNSGIFDLKSFELMAKLSLKQEYLGCDRHSRSGARYCTSRN